MLHTRARKQGGRVRRAARVFERRVDAEEPQPARELGKRAVAEKAGVAGGGRAEGFRDRAGEALPREAREGQPAREGVVGGAEWEAVEVAG